MQGRKIRILLTKSAMDTHDMGMAYVRMKCQEAGMEVIVTQHGVVDEIINTAIQESVDVIDGTIRGAKDKRYISYIWGCHSAWRRS